MVKARRENTPLIPSTLSELAEILEESGRMENLFRGCAVGLDDSIALLFIHDDMLEALSKCSQLFCDGTFKVGLFNF